MVDKELLEKAVYGVIEYTLKVYNKLLSYEEAEELILNYWGIEKESVPTK